MKKHRRVLVACDLEDDSDHVVIEAQRWIDDMDGGEIILTHALSGWLESVVTDAELSRTLRIRYELATRKAGRTVRVQIGHASAHAGVLEVAARTEADLIVVGSPDSRRLVGKSTAIEVARYAHCDVLIVRESPKASTATSPVVVGTDFSPGATSAVTVGVRVALRQGRPLRLAHAIVSDHPARALFRRVLQMDLPEAQELARQSRKAQLEAVARRIGRDDVVNDEILDGMPGVALCGFAESYAASLICVGATGQSGADDVRLGSEAAHVVEFSPCPVLVARDVLPA